MIILISGASHTGKTALSQQLLEKYGFPYFSIDHLKMGLIRSNNTYLTAEDDHKLLDFLWPIIREIIKTNIENNQNLIIEGVYIPFNWQDDFETNYLDKIKFYCLIMSQKYIENKFQDIKKFASVIENRLDDSYCTKESVLEENIYNMVMCEKYGFDYILIDEEYEIDIEI